MKSNKVYYKRGVSSQLYDGGGSVSCRYDAVFSEKKKRRQLKQMRQIFPFGPLHCHSLIPPSRPFTISIFSNLCVNFFYGRLTGSGETSAMRIRAGAAVAADSATYSFSPSLIEALSSFPGRFTKE